MSLKNYKTCQTTYYTLHCYRYQPASASELLSAFRALDPERTGMVSRECIESALRHDGEPFEDEELEEMMSAASIETAPGTVVIPYELYINKILVRFLSCVKFTRNYHNTICLYRTRIRRIITHTLNRRHSLGNRSGTT